MTRLEVRDLTCGYADRSVIESLSMQARPGEMLVLLGPNGSGKTTLLRAMARLLRPTHGAVLLDEAGIWTRPASEVARNLALMPQSERRDSPLTVTEAVMLGRAPHRGWLLPFSCSDRQIVEDSLARCTLAELRDRPITELSGGEWRRVILARALAQQARVLLLDEPVSSLDLRFQVEVLHLVRELAVREKMAVVCTLHDLNLAAIYGQRIAILSHGALVACGEPTEVLSAERIGQVFGVSVVVAKHPVYGTPLVVPLTEPHSAPGEV